MKQNNKSKYVQSINYAQRMANAIVTLIENNSVTLRDGHPNGESKIQAIIFNLSEHHVTPEKIKQIGEYYGYGKGGANSIQFSEVFCLALEKLYSDKNLLNISRIANLAYLCKPCVNERLKNLVLKMHQDDKFLSYHNISALLPLLSVFIDKSGVSSIENQVVLKNIRNIAKQEADNKVNRALNAAGLQYIIQDIHREYLRETFKLIDTEEPSSDSEEEEVSTISADLIDTPVITDVMQLEKLDAVVKVYYNTTLTLANKTPVNWSECIGMLVLCDIELEVAGRCFDDVIKSKPEFKNLIKRIAIGVHKTQDESLAQTLKTLGIYKLLGISGPEQMGSIVEEENAALKTEANELLKFLSSCLKYHNTQRALNKMRAVDDLSHERFRDIISSSEKLKQIIKNVILQASSTVSSLDILNQFGAIGIADVVGITPEYYQNMLNAYATKNGATYLVTEGP